MQRLSYPTETTVLSNKITRNRIVLSFKDSPRKPLGRRPLVFTFQPSTVQRDTNLENKSQDGLNFLPIPSVDVELETISEKKRNGAAAPASAAAAAALTPVSS